MASTIELEKAERVRDAETLAGSLSDTAEHMALRRFIAVLYEHVPPSGSAELWPRATSSPREVTMGIMEFQVCRQGRDAHWVVRLGDSVYGAYLDKEQALLDAVDAARDALQCGREAQVWVRERTNAARIF